MDKEGYTDLVNHHLVVKVDILDYEGRILYTLRDWSEKKLESSGYDSILTDAGKEKAKVLKTVSEVTNSDLKTALLKVEELPYTMEFSSKYKAKHAKKKLDELGAKTVIE